MSQQSLLPLAQDSNTNHGGCYGQYERQQQQIIVRFASSLPDLPLSISDPDYTIVLTLKVLIRKHLAVATEQSSSSNSNSSSRLNLIYAGRLLHNNEVVSTALRLRQRQLAAATLPPPPPPKKGSSAKGKEPAAARSTDARQSPPPLYVHCSLGESLTTQEVENEVAQAAAAEDVLRSGLYGQKGALTSPFGSSRQSLGQQQHGNETDPRSERLLQQQQQQQQQQPPVGFDRLLGSGWTADDVVSLRASFLAHLSYSHTPSTMPNGDALRLLEERWLDCTGPGGGGSSDSRGSDPGALLGQQSESLDEQDALMLQQFDEDEAGALDDGLWGSMVGFFWPWAAVWRWHEPGVWTERRNMMVLLGVVVNLVFGVMRLITSREDSF